MLARFSNKGRLHTLTITIPISYQPHILPLRLSFTARACRSHNFCSSSLRQRQFWLCHITHHFQLVQALSSDVSPPIRCGRSELLSTTTSSDHLLRPCMLQSFFCALARDPVHRWGRLLFHRIDRLPGGGSALRKIDHERNVVRLILPTSPQHLSTANVYRLALTALLKHQLCFTRLTAALERDGNGFELPRIEIEGQLDIISEDVKAFSNAVTHQDKVIGEETIINPFFLVALTVPLAVQILASNSCPIKPLGAVNTRNVFKIHNAALCRDAAALQASKLVYKAAFGGADNPGHRRKRGVEFCITIDISFEGELVLSQELWYLQFLPASYEPRFVTKSVEEKFTSVAADGTGLDRSQTLDLDMNAPRRWAACCKDYNPIHISNFAAKLFGFRSVIAHGSHVTALVVEQLRKQDIGMRKGASQDARKLCWQSQKPFSIDVFFSRPLLLPARAGVYWSWDSDDSSKSNFGVAAKDKLCISGSISSIQGSI